MKKCTLDNQRVILEFLNKTHTPSLKSLKVCIGHIMQTHQKNWRWVQSQLAGHQNDPEGIKTVLRPIRIMERSFGYISPSFIAYHCARTFAPYLSEKETLLMTMYAFERDHQRTGKELMKSVDLNKLQDQCRSFFEYNQDMCSHMYEHIECERTRRLKKALKKEIKSKHHATSNRKM